MFTYGIIILAAGNSSRLGQPKQLLPFKDANLLQHAIDKARVIHHATVVTVLGAWEEQIRSSIQWNNTHLVFNERWQDGMGTSISLGLSSLILIEPAIAAVIFLVCDQPFLSIAHLEQLISAHEISGKGIVASTYQQTIGVPVLFSRLYFDELMRLSEAQGAKKLISRYTHDLTTIAFPEGAVDIDTINDYHSLME